jgi:sugar-specific transcriptional regulator TrmB
MKNLLTKVGLSEKEAEVYLIGLSSIKPTAQYFAKKTGIKRSSIYDILNSLSQK